MLDELHCNEWGRVLVMAREVMNMSINLVVSIANFRSYGVVELKGRAEEKLTR